MVHGYGGLQSVLVYCSLLSIFRAYGSIFVQFSMCWYNNLNLSGWCYVRHSKKQWEMQLKLLLVLTFLNYNMHKYARTQTLNDDYLPQDYLFDSFVCLLISYIYILVSNYYYYCWLSRTGIDTIFIYLSNVLRTRIWFHAYQLCNKKACCVCTYKIPYTFSSRRINGWLSNIYAFGCSIHSTRTWKIN